MAAILMPTEGPKQKGPDSTITPAKPFDLAEMDSFIDRIGCPLNQRCACGVRTYQRLPKEQQFVCRKCKKKASGG
jgi:hypothetical protein